MGSSISILIFAWEFFYFLLRIFGTHTDDTWLRTICWFHMRTWYSLKCLQDWVTSSANDYLNMSIVISFHVPVDEGWLHMCNFTFFLGHMMNLTYSCPFLSRRRMHYVIFQVSWVGKINERKWRSRNNRGVGFCQMVVSLQCVHVSCSHVSYM